MTKKDYVLIAEAIKQTHTEAIKPSLAVLVGHLCMKFAVDNPRFDGPTFIAACFGK